MAERAVVAESAEGVRARGQLDRRQLDVRLGRLASLMGGALSFAWVFGQIAENVAIPLWWSIGKYAIGLLFLINVLFGGLLPRSVMRSTWCAIPFVGAVVMLTTFQAHSAEFGAAREMWDLGFQLTSAYLCLLALVLPDGRTHLWINAAAVSFALLTGASFWLAYDVLPATAWIMMLQVYSNVILAMLLIEFRRRMRRFYASQEIWRFRELEVARVKTRLQEERELARVAHDHALGLLNASLLWWAANADSAEDCRVRVPEELRTMARDSIALFERMLSQDSAEMSTVQVAARIEASALAGATLVGVVARAGAAGSGPVALEVEAGTLPAKVASALVDATAEAARNVARHADGGRWTVSGTLSAARAVIEIRDAGPGFDPAVVGPDRMGLRSSVLGRMQDLAGGDATIESSPGSGTLVKLVWARAARAESVS